MKYTYLTLAAMLMAAPFVKAVDTNVDAQQETQKAETISKKTRAKHFGAGLVKATACLGQLYCLLPLLRKCQYDFKYATNYKCEPIRSERANICAFGGVVGASLIYGSFLTGKSALQSFKQEHLLGKKSN